MFTKIDRAARVTLVLLMALMPVVSSDAQAIHPTAANLPEGQSGYGVVSATTQVESAVRDMASRIAAARVAQVLGASLEGGESELLAPSAVAIDADGRTLVLDELGAMHVYSQDGAYLGGVELPRIGWSPHPNLLVLASGRLLVIRGNGVLELADATGGYAVLNEHTLPEAANASCILGGALVMQVGGEGEPVRVRDTPLDDRSSAIGRSYDSPTPDVRRQMGNGTVACDPDGQTIYAAFTLLPWVVAMDRGGEEFWRSAIADFRPFVVEERYKSGNLVLTSRAPEGGADHLAGLFVLKAGLLLAQVARQTGYLVQYDSYIVDTVTGDGVYAGHTLPLITTAFDGRLASISPGAVKLLEY